MLLLALFAAAPERVVVVARQAEKPGFFEELRAIAGKAARRLYQKDDPDVAKGNALAAEGDPAGALREYAKARERLKESPELSFDRASALLKLEAKEAKEAAAEATQALIHGAGPLKAQAAYDLALSTEAMGRADEAMKAYADALALDPADPDSKVNLELLLKSKEERKQKTPQEQQESKEEKQEKEEQKPDPSKGQQKERKKEEPQAGQQEEKQQQEGKETGREEEQKPQEKQQPQAEAQKPVDRSEAERLLDALRAGEKNLQVWRFARDRRKEARRGDVEKDW